MTAVEPGGEPPRGGPSLCFTCVLVALAFGFGIPLVADLIHARLGSNRAEPAAVDSQTR